MLYRYFYSNIIHVQLILCVRGLCASTIYIDLFVRWYMCIYIWPIFLFIYHTSILLRTVHKYIYVRQIDFYSSTCIRKFSVIRISFCLLLHFFSLSSQSTRTLIALRSQKICSDRQKKHTHTLPLHKHIRVHRHHSIPFWACVVCFSSSLSLSLIVSFSLLHCFAWRAFQLAY